MKLENVLAHVPHASLEVPDFYAKRLLVSREQFDAENVFVSDYLIDYFLPDAAANVAKFGFSRMFCDVERFKDDMLESMAEKGMGVVYEKDSNGDKFIQLTDEYRKKVLTDYYDKFHTQVDEMAERILAKNNSCLVIDLHSFSDEFVLKVLRLQNNPDICIGFDEKFKDEKLIERTIKHFERYGYSVATNYPYGGSFVPDKYFGSSIGHLKSVMIEVNKRVYLKNDTTLDQRKAQQLKACFNDYYNSLDF